MQEHLIVKKITVHFSVLLVFLSFIVYARPLYSSLIATHINIELPYVIVASISINFCLKGMYKDYFPDLRITIICELIQRL